MSTLIEFSHIGGGNIEQPTGVNIGLSRFWCLNVITAIFLVLPSLRGRTVNRYNYPHLCSCVSQLEVIFVLQGNFGSVWGHFR